MLITVVLVTLCVHEGLSDTSDGVLKEVFWHDNPDCRRFLSKIFSGEKHVGPGGEIKPYVDTTRLNYDRNNPELYIELAKPMFLTCLDQDHPEVVKFLKSIITPPSKGEYNLTKDVNEIKESPVLVPFEVDTLVYKEQLKGGFFIEAGANDFESDSDSLHFELNHGWSGLLVEPNPFTFFKSQNKNRKANSIPTCLSTTLTPRMMFFNLTSNSFNATSDGLEIMCFPLYSILLALDNPRVDYFSLDVEGAEFPILKTIPWDKVDISVLSIETHFAGQLFEGSRQDIIDYMDSKGYNHIPWGHKITRYVRYPLDGPVIGILNDMFVKKSLPVISREESISLSKWDQRWSKEISQREELAKTMMEMDEMKRADPSFELPSKIEL